MLNPTEKQTHEGVSPGFMPFLHRPAGKPGGPLTDRRAGFPLSPLGRLPLLAAPSGRAIPAAGRGSPLLPFNRTMPVLLSSSGTVLFPKFTSHPGLRPANFFPGETKEFGRKRAHRQGDGQVHRQSNDPDVQIFDRLRQSGE